MGREMIEPMEPSGPELLYIIIYCDVLLCAKAKVKMPTKITKDRVT